MSFVEIIKEITPFMSVLVALAAVILSPLFSGWIAKRQIVAPIRQKWIDELRDLITEFLSTAQTLVLVHETNGILNQDDFDKETYKAMLSIERKLTLMLNPNELLHNDLMKYVRELLDKVDHGAGNTLEFGPVVQRITETTQKILKEEWVRVKKGKI